MAEHHCSDRKPVAQATNRVIKRLPRHARYRPANSALPTVSAMLLASGARVDCASEDQDSHDAARPSSEYLPHKPITVSRPLLITAETSEQSSDTHSTNTVSTSYVDELPTEMLQYIFEKLVEDFQSVTKPTPSTRTHNNNSGEAIPGGLSELNNLTSGTGDVGEGETNKARDLAMCKAILAASGVCKRWRQNVHGLPKLWTGTNLHHYMRDVITYNENFQRELLLLRATALADKVVSMTKESVHTLVPNFVAENNILHTMRRPAMARAIVHLPDYCPSKCTCRAFRPLIIAYLPSIPRQLSAYNLFFKGLASIMSRVGHLTLSMNLTYPDDDKTGNHWYRCLSQFVELFTLELLDVDGSASTMTSLAHAHDTDIHRGMYKFKHLIVKFKSPASRDDAVNCDESGTLNGLEDRRMFDIAWLTLLAKYNFQLRRVALWDVLLDECYKSWTWRGNYESLKVVLGMRYGQIHWRYSQGTIERK